MRNVKGVFHADAISFLHDRSQSEACSVQMIAQARRSILLVGAADSVLRVALDSACEENPCLKIREVMAVNGEWALIIDEHVALIGQGDLGLVAEGEIARAVSDLFQISMHPRSSGSRAASPRWPDWPFRSRVDLESVEVGLSRTWVSRDASPVIEIERLMINAIRSARRFIYLECASLTSPVIANAIAARLKNKEGPEFIVLLPPGRAMKTMREKMRAHLQTAALARILKADAHGKFRAFEAPGPRSGCGLLIVDDQFVKIGTSQPTSRSLGASPAVDLSVEALGRPPVVMAIARLRRERMGHLLSIEPSEFDARFLLNGSLIDTFESFFTPTRNLTELTPEPSAFHHFSFFASPLIDPKRAHGFARWVRKKLRFAPKAWRFAFILLIIFALLITFASLFAPLGL